MWKRLKGLALALLTTLAAASSAAPQNNLVTRTNRIQPRPARAITDSDKDRDGLLGPVRRVRTEVVRLENAAGRLVESKRALLEIAAYDPNGKKTENQYFPFAGAGLTGKEVYRYDDKGNIIEMTLLNDDGSVLGREVYQYEFDFAGNWNKMTTSIPVLESGKVALEQTEITYRSIMYYLDAKITKMVRPASRSANAGSAVNASVATLVNIPATTPSQPPANSSSVTTIANKTADVNRDSPTSLPSPKETNKLTGNRPVEVGGAGLNVAQTPLPLLDLEPPPTLESKALLKPVSGGILNGAALSLPVPHYPDAARRMRQSGVVSVNVVVDETGKVISALATAGPAMLREAAVRAALKARFFATKLSGQPVKVVGVINYRFTLAE